MGRMDVCVLDMGWCWMGGWSNPVGAARRRPCLSLSWELALAVGLPEPRQGWGDGVLPRDPVCCAGIRVPGRGVARRAPGGGVL